LLESENKPNLIALLVQKEVAQRLAAEPGQLSILGVSAQFYAAVELGREIPARLFSPPPKVDSQIVRLVPYTSPLLDVDTERFFKIVKAGFSEKRKKLANSLAGGLAMGKNEAKNVINLAGLAENARAQELSLEQWQKLYNKLYN
jgi:16S rRNA (adenine1518-N6/adenine1519-N6)-dimethyltransferase